VIGHESGIAQPAAHSGRIPLAATGQRPLVVRYIGPGGLRVPQQHQLPARVRRHHPILQIRLPQACASASAAAYGLP
jgi:hypothetical protein